MADAAETGGTGQAVVEQGSGTAATAGTQGNQQSTSQAATTPRTGAAQPGQAAQEDRSTWIPPYRLTEETTKRQRLEAQLADTNRRLQALAGVQPQDPNAERSKQVRDAFFQMFPSFKKFDSLTDEQIDRLLTTPDQVQRVTQSEEREWQRLGKKNLTSLETMVAEQLGSDELTVDQRDDLREGFASWFRTKCQAELQASGGRDSATLRRYEEGDDALLQEYVKRHASNWVEPARRKVTAQTLNRQRSVPDSRGRGSVTQVARPEKFKSLDERLDFAAKLASERGVQFGR